MIGLAVFSSWPSKRRASPARLFLQKPSAARGRSWIKEQELAQERESGRPVEKTKDVTSAASWRLADKLVANRAARSRSPGATGKTAGETGGELGVMGAQGSSAWGAGQPVDGSKGGGSSGRNSFCSGPRRAQCVAVSV